MFAVLLLSLTLSGQEPRMTDRNCTDDNGADRCARLTEDARTLGMPTLDEEQAAGTEVYRIIQIDGYGRLMPGIAYERRVGSSPQVVVYGKEGARMSAPVSPEDWRSVQSMARFADRELAPLPSEPSNALAGICLHSWLSTTEIANGARRGVANEPIRRRTESACGGGLTTTFAFDLTALAIKNFPDCDLLEESGYRNDMTRLEQCLRFKGDRMAAVELMNQIGWSFVPEDADDKALAWARKLQARQTTRLDWGGQMIAGGGSARSPVAAFMAQFQTQNPSLRGYISKLDAVSSTRVEATGRMDMEGPEGANDTRLTAPFTQTWVWDPNSLAWTLDTWIVQPFTPIR